MGMQQRLVRQVIVNDVGTEGGLQSYQLPRNYDSEFYVVTVAAQTNVTTAFVAVRPDAPTQLVRRFEMIADGRTTLVSGSGTALAFQPSLRVSPFNLPQFALKPGSGAVGVTNVQFVWLLPRYIVDGIRPKDANLRTAKSNSLDFRIQLGNCADLFTGAGVGTLQNIRITIDTSEIVEFVNKDGTISTPMYATRQIESVIAIPAANSAQQIKLPTNTILRSIQLYSQVTTSGPANNLINRITVKRGTDTRFTATAQSTQFINTLQNSYQNPTGLYIVDFAKALGGNNNRISEAWAVDGSTDAFVELDVAGTANATVSMLTTEYVKLAA